MAVVEPDAFTTGLWRFNEAANDGPLVQGSASSRGWRSNTGLSAALVQWENVTNVNASIPDPGNALRFDRLQPMSVSVWTSYSGGGIGTVPIAAFLSNAAVTTRRGYAFGIEQNACNYAMRLINTLGTNELRVRTTGAIAKDANLHHVVFVLDGTGLAAGCQIYVDGVSQPLTTAADSLSATIVSNGTLRIGQDGDNGSTINIPVGTLNGVGIYNVALTGPQVAALFALGPLATPSGGGLQGFWRLDRTDDYTVPLGILDRAGVGPYHATANGGLRPLEPTLTNNSIGFTPGLLAGPRTALGFGRDLARWYGPLVNFGAGTIGANSAMGISASTYMYSNCPWVARTLYGPAWTWEAWYFIDRDNHLHHLVGYENPGFGGQIQVLRVTVNTNRGLGILINSVLVSSANSAVPLKQWFHLQITCSRVGGGNQSINAYINNVLVLTNSFVPPANPGVNALSNFFSIGYVSTGLGTLIGGCAYARLSETLRSASERASAAADPANIVLDADTIALWTMQETRSQILDYSLSGMHLIPRDLGTGGAPTAGPFDGFGVTGPTFTDLAHQFIQSGVETDRLAIVRQEIADTWAGQNEATFEQFIRLDQNLTNHRLLFIGGTASSSIDSNIVIQIDLVTTQQMQVLWEYESGYGWFWRSVNAIIALGGTQSGEYGMFWALAVRKRAVGPRNYWRLNGANWVSMGDVAALAFERTQAFSVTARIQRSSTLAAIETVVSKMNNATGQGYSLQLDASGRVEVRLDNGAGQAIERRVTSATVLSGFEFTIGFSYDGSSSATGVNIYINGVLQSMTTDTNTLASGSILTTAPFAVGSRNGATNFLNGYVREVAVANRVLTAAEHLEAFRGSGLQAPDLMASTFASALVGYWRFNQADTALTVDDKTASNNNGVAQAGLTPTAKNSVIYDFFRNAVLFESTDFAPEPIVGDIQLATSGIYQLQIRGAGEQHTLGVARMSNKARSEEELLDFFDTSTGEPAAPEFSIDIISPLPVGSIIGTDEPLVFLIRSSSPFTRIMIAVGFPGFPFAELAFAQNPAVSTAFETAYAGSSISAVSDPELTVFRFELRRSPLWPDSPLLRAYAFAGGAEL